MIKENPEKRDLITKIQALLLFPIGICLISMLLLGLFNQMYFFAIPAALAGLLSFVEAFLAVEKKELSKESESNPSSDAWESLGEEADSSHQKESKTPYAKTSATDGVVYGWDQEGDLAEYDLISDFDDYIKRTFPFLPLPLYKVPKNIFERIKDGIDKAKQIDASTLRELALSMEKHLGYDEEKVIVIVKEAEPGQRIAGTHERFITSFSSITLYYSEAYNVYNIIQIMAHEMSHAFQQYYGRPFYNDDEDDNEKFTDALAIYLGFGNIYKYGQKYTADGKIHRLGYLNDNSLICVDEIQKNRFAKERPIREYQARFAALQEKANALLEENEERIYKMHALIDSIETNRSGYESIILPLKHKYLDSDYLVGCSSFVDNLIQYPEEEANKRVGALSSSLQELREALESVQDFINNQ